MPSLFLGKQTSRFMSHNWKAFLIGICTNNSGDLRVLREMGLVQMPMKLTFEKQYENIKQYVFCHNYQAINIIISARVRER